MFLTFYDVVICFKKKIDLSSFLDTGFPKCSIEIYFEDVSTEKWDHKTHYKMMVRGYDMR